MAAEKILIYKASNIWTRRTPFYEIFGKIVLRQTFVKIPFSHTYLN